MIRVAAVGDLHLGAESAGRYRAQLEPLPDDADLLVVAGDLTRVGSVEEAGVAANELRDLGVPVVAVLGNHDYHSDAQRQVTDTLTDAGIAVLEGSGTVVEVDGTRVGVAGTKGFGGGFVGASASEFGEPEMKDFVRHTMALAAGLEDALSNLRADLRIALLHYAPIPDTLQGERPDVYPFLGSYLLGEAVDRAGADLIVHGHAHAGVEKGITPGGIHVRNVAQPVIDRAYHLYALQPDAIAVG